jgi:hypothetical protein
MQEKRVIILKMIVLPIKYRVISTPQARSDSLPRFPLAISSPKEIVP